MHKDNTRPPNYALALIGGGPKSLAVVLLAFVLRRLKIADFTPVIIEQHSVGANWSGVAGYTDGNFPVDTSPLKDLTFPGVTGYTPQVDHEIGHFSFIEFLKDTGEYVRFVSRGDYKVSHRLFCQYLRWVAEKIQPQMISATVTRITPMENEVQLTLSSRGQEETLVVGGVVVTGPGVPKSLVLQDEAPGLIFNGKNYWTNRASFHELKNGHVAVVGGGQTAGTVAKSLLQENPGLRVDIINRHGFLVAQSAGFHENALCTEPGEEWLERSLAERREILAKVNNGVVEASVKQFLDFHPDVRLLRGSVNQVCAVGNKVHLHLAGTSRKLPLQYDRVVVAIGFDPMGQLEQLLSDPVVRSDWFTDLHNYPDLDYHFRLPGLDCNIHVPALSGLSQGVGYMLLSALGTGASRIVQTYIPLPDGAKEKE